MPGKVKVKIISGRNLPVMDRSSDTTDAYVEIKLGTTTYKTDVCRKSLHPQWNSEWYRFELDDAELQDEPLQIRLMDHDTYSANDAIGKVYLDLNPLLLPVTSLLGKWNDGSNSCHEGNSSVMSGWIPVYDTMHGIRGEVNVIVKVELFTDFNKFRQSSCGVQFFCSPAIPHGFYAQIIQGFVEELVVSDDPEYQWIDKIRTPRASNEARQTLFCKLSGELQRRIGLKALEMGGNAVIGYNQCFDLEGESGIVARGIGTAVTLVKIMDLPSPSPNVENNSNEERVASYLKFLGSAKGFYLNNNANSNKFKSHLYPLPSPTASFRSLKEKRVLKPERMPPHLTRHLSDREFNYPLPIGPESTMHHSVSLQTLLKQEDQRGRAGYGISQRFRKLKNTSQNMITRKMTALKAKLASEDGDGEGKRIPIRYRRTQSDNTGMAEILVRSVFHATTSLDCIAESPKVSDEEPRDRSFLSLPMPTGGSSPTSSCNSNDTSSADEDEDDDDEEDEEDLGGDTIGELDTVSHIVETVRKLSRIHAPIEPSELDYEDSKFMFVIGDADDQTDAGFDEDIEDANLLYYQDTDDVKSESLLPQFVRAFERMRKALSGTDLQLGEDRRLNKKFTSLHNIHHSQSRWNKYSAHGGKETVLGELFRRIDSAHPLFEIDSESLGSYPDAMKDSRGDLMQEEAQEVNVGLKRTKPLKLIIPEHGEHQPDDKPLEYVGNISEGPELQRDRDNNDKKSKRDHKSFIPKKVRHVLHKLDSKIHHKTKQGIRNDHGLINTALGNVLMDTVQDVLATSHSASPENKPQGAPHLPGHSHVLDLEERGSGKLDSPSGSLPHASEEHTPFSGSDEHKHGLLHKLKAGKDKLLHAPAELLHKLDTKIHDFGHGTEKSGIKNEHGLLNIALENVLIDSMQEVLVTSHTASPDGKPPEFPVAYQHPAQEESKESGSREDIALEHSLGSDNRRQSILHKVKEGTKDLMHKIHDIGHHHSAGLKDEHGLPNVALGNVHMDSVREVSETSSPRPDEDVPQFLSHEPEVPKSMPDEIADHHKHGFLEKLLHGPKELLHRLDSKIHGAEEEKSAIKNEHGILKIALSNVLMDSVQEVLATSHSETPTPQTIPPPPMPPPDVPATTNCHSDRSVGTQTDGGDHNCINTTHACLTVTRNVETTAPPVTAATNAPEARVENGHHRTESLGVRISHSPAKINAIPCIHRRSSDSDLSITPKGILRKRNSLTGSDRSGGYSSGQYMRGAMVRTTRPQENFDIMEYPFLTLSKYPPGFIAHIGGTVSARSVKLLERISNLEEPESRDTWWSEIRMEIRSHARALNCNAVLGYTESTSICDDVCVLSASGTAAVLGFPNASSEAADNVGGLPTLPKSSNSTMTTSLDRNDFEKDRDKERDKEIAKDKLKLERGEEKDKDKDKDKDREKLVPCKTKVLSANCPPLAHLNTSPDRDSSQPQGAKPSCSMAHLPYVSNSKPLRSSATKCCLCGACKVPDMLIATIEIPEGMPNLGRGCFIQSYVCRPLKDLKGESNAKEISDGLPFLEYELHRFLINKLKVKGMNAIFGLKVRISVGERMLIGIATGTAVFLSSLPPPLLPKLVSDRTTDERKLTQLQKDLHDTIRRNREIYQLKSIEEVNGESGKAPQESDGSEDETAALDLSMGNKDCCILEVDDPDDADVLKSLMEPRPPDGFHVVNTELVPGLEDLEIVKNLQMFTQIWRAKIPPPFDLDKHFHRLLQSVYFKLRRMIPCALCDLQFRVDSPEPDEIQLCVLGMALGLGDPLRNPKKRKAVIPKRADDDLIFNLEEDQIPEHSVAQTTPTSHLLQAQSLKHRQKSPVRNKLLTKQRHVPYRERHGVDITPLSYVPGGKIEKYLGNLNFFFIRETTSLREEGGLSGFVHSFVTEILAIVRAHVTALGGNAMVAYFITECVLNHNLHKNQGQCLINVGGDVVYVSYFTEDH